MAAILRYLYLKTAKMQHKSAKKFVICRNIFKLPFNTVFSLKLTAVRIILFDVPVSIRLDL